MKEKKKLDELLAETPEARQSPSTRRGQQASTVESGQSELRDMIARRAYEIYEERGRSDGGDMDDWLRAEAEVIKAEKRRPAPSRASVRQ